VIEVEITGTDAVVARLESMSDKIRQSLRDAMQQQWYALQSYVVTEKLSGDPLHRRTAFLASSINTDSTFTDDATSIVGRVGTKVIYGRVHEYGGTFTIPAHERRVTSVFGHPVAGGVTTVRSHSATFPERSFLRSSMRDLSSQIREAMQQAVADAIAAG
jgi:phage gpG-like protein